MPLTPGIGNQGTHTHTSRGNQGQGRGLQAEARYRVEEIDGGEPRLVQGRELLETGLRVTAAKPQAALIFIYRRQP